MNIRQLAIGQLLATACTINYTDNWPVGKFGLP